VIVFEQIDFGQNYFTLESGLKDFLRKILDEIYYGQYFDVRTYTISIAAKYNNI